MNEKGEIENSYIFASSIQVDHQAVVGVVKSLETDLIIKTEQLSEQFWELTEEALSVVENGSPGAPILALFSRNRVARYEVHSCGGHRKRRAHGCGGEGPVQNRL